MSEHRPGLRGALAVSAVVFCLGLGCASTAGASGEPDPVDAPATDPPATEPPATDPPTTEPTDPADESPDDDTNWDAYLVAGVLGFLFLVIVAAWVMVNRRDDDAGPQAEQPTSL